MSAGPIVRLVAACPRPLDTAVAAARTCYSARGPVDPAAVAAERTGDGEQPAAALARRDALAHALYTAGHHTTYQHAHFVFVLERVSRQFVWSFLHAHPFANSEQVSQRYVTVAPDAVHMPDLPDGARAAYLATVEAQHRAYERLCDLLGGIAEAELLSRYPSWRRHPKRLQRQTRRKAQEVARSVLPIATHTALYHTVSCLTLFRYQRMCRLGDVGREAHAVVRAMVDAVTAFDPGLASLFEPPIDPDATLGYALDGALRGHELEAAAHRREFDALLGDRTSRLVGAGTGNVAAVATAVRAVLGVTPDRLGDEEAVRVVLDPSSNRLLGEDLNVTTLDTLSRCLHHAHYTFAKKLSHAADSQDQRHRMTPAARPRLSAVVDDAPDVVVPRLVAHAGGEARAIFDAAVARAWEGTAAVRAAGAPREDALYLLPNAVALRFIESSDLLNLHHKHKMRLCYNAQEEIWQASLDEALQITACEPAIGRWLMPPCGVRQLAGRRPYCSEGDHFCGVSVWKLSREQYRRLI